MGILSLALRGRGRGGGGGEERGSGDLCLVIDDGEALHAIRGICQGAAIIRIVHQDAIFVDDVEVAVRMVMWEPGL